MQLFVLLRRKFLVSSNILNYLYLVCCFSVTRSGVWSLSDQWSQSFIRKNLLQKKLMSAICLISHRCYELSLNLSWGFFYLSESLPKRLLILVNPMQLKMETFDCDNNESVAYPSIFDRLEFWSILFRWNLNQLQRMLDNCFFLI